MHDSPVDREWGHKKIHEEPRLRHKAESWLGRFPACLHKPGFRDADDIYMGKMSQTANGLEYLHKHDIVHGDIRGVSKFHYQYSF